MATNSLNLPYLFLAGSIALAAVIVFTILQPSIAAIQALQQEVATTQAQLAERETFLRTLDTKLAELETNRDHEVRLQTILPNEVRMEDTLRVIYQAAQGSGLTVDGVVDRTSSVQSERRAQASRGEAGALPDEIVPLAATVSFTGTYQGLRGFLTALEKAPRLIDVETLVVKRDERDTSQITGELTTAFYLIKKQNR